MELLKLFVLAGIATLCSGLEGDNSSTIEMTSPTVETATMSSPTMMTNTVMITPTPSSTMDTVSPSTVIVTASRVYYDLAFYQQIYLPNGTSDSVYRMAAPYRYSRYNVSDLITLCACFEFTVTLCIEVCHMTLYSLQYIILTANAPYHNCLCSVLNVIRMEISLIVSLAIMC